MTTKDNAKANVINAQKTEEQKIHERVKGFCEQAISSQIERASKEGSNYTWVEAPMAIISKQDALSEYLRTVGGFADEDILWHGNYLRIAWGE